MTYKDASGRERYRYILIPKDQGQRAFASIFDALWAKAIDGKNPNMEQVRMASQNALNFLPTNLPPTIAAVLGYSNNINFWTNEPYWRGAKVEPSAEVETRGRGTHPLFVEVGQATGLSPTRLQGAMSSVVPPSNPIVLWPSTAWRYLTENVPESAKKEVHDTMIRDLAGIGRFLRTTPAYSRNPVLEQKAVAENTRRLKQNQALQKLIDADALKPEVDSYVKGLPDEADRDRLNTRYKRAKAWRGVDSEWYDIAELPPEARATEAALRFLAAPPEKKAEVVKLIRLPGIASESGRFWGTFRKIAGKEWDQYAHKK
jgi:hypothetical protein